MPKKLYEDEPETQSVGIGTFDSFTSVPTDDKPLKKKAQIGFIRNNERANNTRRKAGNTKKAVRTTRRVR